MTTLRSHAALVALFVASLPAGAARAQPAPAPLTPLQIAVACAPPPEFYAPHADAVQVAGAQDTVPRNLFDAKDLLVLNGGSNRGLALGQEYFLRRGAGFTPAIDTHVRGLQTSGWIRIVAVNQTTAIASVEHACGPILQHDYLVPFAVPDVPDVPAADTAPASFDFTAAAHLLFGDDDRPIAGIGEFMLIDRGLKQGATPGSRLGIYRDFRRSSVSPVEMGDDLPLASVADAVVVSAGPDAALIRIGNARDAVRRGDLAVPLK